MATPRPPPSLLRDIQRRHSGSITQITKSNFLDTLPEIAKHIRAADFIAVSSQSTGSAFPPTASPHSPWWHRISPIDSLETAYLKSKVAAERFQVLQFAICPFRLRGSKVVAHPYNFHLFPRDELNIGLPSYTFSCQTSSINSMAREGFDFNLCIYDGLSYLSRVQENMMKHENPFPKLHSMASTVLSAADKIFMEKIKLRIEQWHNACSSSNPNEDALVRSLRKLLRGGDIYGSRPCLNIDVCSHLQVLLVAQVLKQSFHYLVPLITPDKGGEVKEVKVVLTSSEKDRNLLLNEIQSIEEEKDKGARGFREVIDMIACSEKPVIAYNALDDFAFIHSKFIGPLPPTMAEFMCSLRLVFPSVIDINSLMREVNALKKVNSMPAAMSRLSQQFFVPVEIEIPEKDAKKSGKKHGHLALKITSLFAKLSVLLKIDSPDDHQRITSNYAYIFPPTHTILEENEDLDPDDLSDDVAIANEMEKMKSSSIIFLWGFNKVGPTEELKKHLIGSHRAFSKNFDLKMVDETCAVAIFSDSRASKELLEDISSGRINVHKLSDMISNGLRVSSYEAYRKACELGIWERDLAGSLEKSLLHLGCNGSSDGEKEFSEIYWNDKFAININDL